MDGKDINLFELLELDPSSQWDFPKFQAEVKRLLQKHNNLSLKSPKQEQREKSKEVVFKLTRTVITKENFDLQFQQARLKQNERKQEDSKRKKAALLTGVEYQSAEGYLLQSVYDKFSKEFSAQNSLNELVEYMRSLEIEIVPSSYGEQKVAGNMFQTADLAVYLQKIGKKDLYDFLGLSTDASIVQLGHKAEQQYRNNSGSGDRDTTIQKLGSLAKSHFKSDETKRNYDELLTCAKIRPAWDYVDNTIKLEPATIINAIRTSVIFNEVKRLVGQSSYSDEELLGSLKLYALRRYGVWLVKPRPSNAITPLSVVLPAAKPAKPIDERPRLKSEAEFLLLQRRYADALVKVVEAINAKPGAKDTVVRECQELRSRIGIKISEYSTARNSVVVAIKNKQLVAAQAAIQRWQDLTYSGDADLEPFKSQIDQAAKAYKAFVGQAAQAASKKNYDTAIGDYTQAIEHCVDEPTVVEKRRAIIEQWKDEALRNKSKNLEKCYELLTGLADTLRTHNIKDTFDVGAERHRVETLLEKGNESVRKIERSLETKSIREARRLIDEFPEYLLKAKHLQQVAELENATQSARESAKNSLEKGDFHSGLRTLNRIRELYCVDDPEINNAIDSFDKTVIGFLRSYELNRQWDILSRRAKEVLADAASLQLNTRIDEIRELYESAVQKIAALEEAKAKTLASISRKRYFEARRSLEQWALVSGQTDESYSQERQKVDQTIADVEQLFAHASRHMDPFSVEAMSLYREIAEICTDHEHTNLRLTSQPPDAPRNLRLKVLAPGTLEFKWEVPTRSNNMQFRVYDTQGMVCETKSTTFVLSAVENGRLHTYYAIAIQDTVRSGQSNSVSYIGNADVRNIALNHVAGKAILSWTAPDNVSRILLKSARDGKILRNLPGDETQIVFVSSELPTEDFFIVCRYDVDATRQEMSDGVRIALPSKQDLVAETKLPAAPAIDQFHARLASNSITCSWHWLQPMREASINVVVKSRDSNSERHTLEVTAFSEDEVSSYTLPISGIMTPGNNVSINVIIKGVKGVHTRDFWIPSYRFTYEYETKKRLFRTSEFWLIVEAHGLTNATTLLADLHQSTQPILVPQRKTIVKTLKFDFSPETPIVKTQIYKASEKEALYSRLYQAEFDLSAQFELVDQTALTDKDTLLS